MDDTLQSLAKSKSMRLAAPEESVLDVFNAMKRHKVRHIPVVEKGKAVGIISDRDLQFVNATGDGFQLKAKDIMTPNPFSVDSMTSIPHVVNIMANKKINSVLIHDKKQKVVGIFTSTDALNILCELYKPKEREEANQL